MGRIYFNQARFSEKSGFGKPLRSSFSGLKNKF
jgi:hypothetical protein